MTFSIAGWEFALDGAGLGEAWAPFAVPAKEPLFRLTVERDAGARVPVAPSWPLLRAAPDGALEISGDGFSATLAADRRSATVRGPDAAYPAESVLRLALADWLERKGGVLVHGVAVAAAGRAALFTGPSGAGKTTLALCGARAGLEVLADELVAVVPDGDGFVVHGTPWNVGTPKQARLALVGTLAHAPQARLVRIESSAVLRVLLSNLLEPADAPAIRARLFQLAGGVLNAVPARQLEFAPDAGVAKVVREALS